ncbi:MAG: UDP-glucose 4-epimerase GalE [Bacteroidetes bacterium GWF2_38_335]|nr:MAG: UDP-glucose 4-epimerase GalE [Bacteroidetes bacterium GWF2_38_335]OFY77059.1 MAG: UDP-glucose 4-epimerase GalE [Bacteroidetes bacterium RIFOXYA12_FULL_38_20]HBS86840.1 UDP-glucose 4-epimerase GalE [Bacteroidales bacterium]
MKKKILVTGGTGYIGSHTAVELINRGYEVIIIDNLSNSSADVLNGIEQITGIRPAFFQFDLCDNNQTVDFFNSHRDISATIHFAAFKAVSESVEKPLKYYRNNLVSLINLLEGMKLNNQGNLVFSSSCTVYGQPDFLPVDENAPIKEAESPYGNTKQISEDIIKDFAKSTGNFKTISLRYFNPIGSHPSAFIGELPLGVPENLVPYITQTAVGKREKLRVFGNDYNTRDGSCIRDYINVNDIAAAHVLAIERMINGKCKSNFEIYNLGSGTGVTVLEVIRAFEKATGINLNYEIVSRRPGDVEQVFADASLALKELGWKASTSLEDTMKSAWNWELQLNKQMK